MPANHSAVRICFLVSLFHVVVVLCCFVFQHLECYHTKKSSYANYADFVDSFRKEHQINGSERLAVARLKKLLHLEEQRKIREKFNKLENAYLFTLTSFTALGKLNIFFYLFYMIYEFLIFPSSYQFIFSAFSSDILQPAALNIERSSIFLGGGGIGYPLSVTSSCLKSLRKFIIKGHSWSHHLNINNLLSAVDIRLEKEILLLVDISLRQNRHTMISSLALELEESLYGCTLFCPVVR